METSPIILSPSGIASEEAVGHREQIDDLFKTTEKALEERFVGMLKYAHSEEATPSAMDRVCRGVTHDILENLKAHLRLSGLLKED